MGTPNDAPWKKGCTSWLQCNIKGLDRKLLAFCPKHPKLPVFSLCSKHPIFQVYRHPLLLDSQKKPLHQIHLLIIERSRDTRIPTTVLNCRILNIHHSQLFWNHLGIERVERNTRSIVSTPLILSKPHPFIPIENTILLIRKFPSFLIAFHKPTPYPSLTAWVFHTPSFTPYFPLMICFQRVPILFAKHQNIYMEGPYWAKKDI